MQMSRSLPTRWSHSETDSDMTEPSEQKKEPRPTSLIVVMTAIFTSLIWFCALEQIIALRAGKEDALYYNLIKKTHPHISPRLD